MSKNTYVNVEIHIHAVSLYFSYIYISLVFVHAL